MMNFLVMVLGALGCVACGRCVCFALGRRQADAEAWGLSCVLGVVATSWLSFVWSLCGGRLGAPFSWSLTLLSLIGATWLVVRERRTKSLPKTPNNLSILCQWLIAFLIAAAFAQTLLTPQRFWDERAIFAIKAKVLWTEQSIHSPVLHDPYFVQYHPKYPLLIPLAEQHLYALIGGVEDRWSKVLFPLLYAGLVLTYAGVLQRRYGASWGWFSGLLIATIPALMPYEYGFLSGQADAPVGCLHGLAVLYLWDSFSLTNTPERRHSVVLSGLCAAAVVFTKDEGIAFLLVDLIAWGLAVLCGVPVSESWWIEVRRRFRFLDGILFLMVVAAITAPWFAHRRSLPDTTEMNYLGRVSLALVVEKLPTLKWSLPHLWQRMFIEWRTWGLQWWLAVMALITVPRVALTAPQQFLIWNVLGALAALLVAGMIAPAELEDHLGGSSHRYLMQLAPLALLLVMSQWVPRPPSRHAEPS